MYSSLTRNDRGDTVYMNCVTKISSSWLASILDADHCPLLHWSDPLDSPPPFFDSKLDTVMCYVIPKFGLSTFSSAITLRKLLPCRIKTLGACTDRKVLRRVCKVSTECLEHCRRRVFADGVSQTRRGLSMVRSVVTGGLRPRGAQKLSEERNIERLARINHSDETFGQDLVIVVNFNQVKSQEQINTSKASESTERLPPCRDYSIYETRIEEAFPRGVAQTGLNLAYMCMIRYWT